jgi:hypothetical protein
MRGAAKCEQKKNLHQSSNPEQLISELHKKNLDKNTPAMRMPPAAGQSFVEWAPCSHQWSKREIAAVKKQAAGTHRHTNAAMPQIILCALLTRSMQQ